MTQSYDQTQFDNMNAADFTKEDNLSFQLGERDAENERLKTTVVALNEKLLVYGDIEKDLKMTQASLKDSENSR